MACDERFIQEIVTMLREPNREVTLLLSVKEGTPENGWRTSSHGGTHCIVISADPPEVHTENRIRLAMGHDVESLRK